MRRRQIGFVHLKGGVGASLLTTAYAHHWALHEGPSLIVDTQGTIADVHTTSKHAIQLDTTTWQYNAPDARPVIIRYDPTPLPKTIDEYVAQLQDNGLEIGAVLVDAATTDWARHRRLLNCPIATTTASVTSRRYNTELRSIAGSEITVETFARSPSEPNIIRFPVSMDWDAAAANGMLSPTQLGDTPAAAALVRLHHAIKDTAVSGRRDGHRLDIWLAAPVAAALDDIDDIDNHLRQLVAAHNDPALPQARTKPAQSVRWRPTIEQPTYETIDALATKLNSDVSRTLRALLSQHHS